MKNKGVVIAVLLPFLVLCLLIVRAEYHIQNGEPWSFQLQGYDPRDLLRGHYLRLNVTYNMDTSKNTCSFGKECCLCLTKTDARTPKVYQTSCSIAKTQCDGFMLLSESNSIRRYYVPEAGAHRAEKILTQAHRNREAYLNVSINNKGEAAITDLIINNQSLNHLLQQSEQSK